MVSPMKPGPPFVASKRIFNYYATCQMYFCIKKAVKVTIQMETVDISTLFTFKRKMTRNCKC